MSKRVTKNTTISKAYRARYGTLPFAGPGFHTEGLAWLFFESFCTCGVRKKLPRSPRLALLTLRMRNRSGKLRPSETMNTSSPSVKKARRDVPLGTVTIAEDIMLGGMRAGGGGGLKLRPQRSR